MRRFDEDSTEPSELIGYRRRWEMARVSIGAEHVQDAVAQFAIRVLPPAPPRCGRGGAAAVAPQRAGRAGGFSRGPEWTTCLPNVARTLSIHLLDNSVLFLYSSCVPFSPRQSIEQFQLVFLRALAAKGEDKSLIVLKGGCNLRFFLGSARFSEDVDFDVRSIRRETLQNKVNRLLQSPLVTAPLKTLGMDVVDMSTPKQTDTTQRWKLGLRVRGVGVPLRTKIEFSRRDTIEGSAFERVDRGLLQPYGLTPFLATHYTAHAAIAQKIVALAGRSEPQARDVFDASHLFARADSVGVRLSPTQRRSVPAAIENASGVTYDGFRSKVVAFLDPEQADLFGSETVWNEMQDAVLARLAELR